MEETDNIPFIISEEFHEDEYEWVPYDYSIDDCINLTETALRMFGFENRFYFVTTFLLREGYIQDLSEETLNGITSDNLENTYQQLIQRYLDVDLHPEYDQHGNHRTLYLCALDASFSFPRSLCTASLIRYLDIAHLYHIGLLVGNEVEEALIPYKPIVCR